MSTQPNQSSNPDQNSYGGYGGYQPPKPADDPYGAYYQPAGTTGTGNQPSDPNYVYGQQSQQGQQYTSSSTSGQQQQQQYNTYQPPSSVSGKSYGASSRTSTKLDPKLAALFSYLGLCFTGLFFFFWERKNRLVRFSAAQSIVLFLPLVVITGILKAIIGFISPIWIIGWLIGGFLSLVLMLIGVVTFILWLFLMLQAYRGVEVKLPFVGEYAETLLRMFSPKQKKAGN
jgi:uncharacterized membrane protein